VFAVDVPLVLDLLGHEQRAVMGLAIERVAQVAAGHQASSGGRPWCSSPLDPLHDVAKLACTRTDPDGRISFRGHSRRGALLAHEELQARGIEHCAACLLARIDGTSPVEYLPEEDKRLAVRRLGCRLLREHPRQWSEVLGMTEESLAV
jgi:hypothetical protein